MIDNTEIGYKLSLYSKLLELHNGNPFKVKAYANAAFQLKKLPEGLASLSEEKLREFPSLGKGLAEKIHEIGKTGSFEELNDLLTITPKGVLDLLSIKGLGAKKVEIIWREMGIETVGELLYACKENRLVEAKGFGIKTQESIIKEIEFKLSNQGSYHYYRMEPVVASILQTVRSFSGVNRIEVSGQFRMLDEIITHLEFVVNVSTNNLETNLINTGFHIINTHTTEIETIINDNLPVIFHLSNDENFATKWFETSSSNNFKKAINYQTDNYKDEDYLFSAHKLPFIVAELRHGNEKEVSFAKQGKQEQLIHWDFLKGILHNHTTWSDGLNTLEEMAIHCKSLGFEYLGICDHSQTAVYAKGLEPDRLLKQMDEIDSLNTKLAPFVIFKGIESDILGDGSLDYDTSILRKLDFVVASVHSNLKMDMEKAHSRLVPAIENQYTTILGHPTGRLVLMRQGYPINHQYIIDCCAANGVAIELNANPYRLDIDWRWIDYATNKGVKISINPDAHEKDGFLDMQYGVNVARKGMLTIENCLNALNKQEIDSYFKRKRGS